MATATNTPQGSYAARSPVPGRVLVAVAALVAAALIVTLVDGDDGGSPAPAAAVQAPATDLTAAQAASAARLAGMAATTAAANAGPALAAAVPSDIWDFRTFGASGPVPVLRPFDIVSGDIPAIVPFDRPVVGEIWERPDVVGGTYDAFAPPPAAFVANPRQELR